MDWQIQPNILHTIQTNEVLAKSDQTALIISNNKFNKSLARIIIEVNNPTREHNIDNQSITFQNWLCKSTINNANLIHGVEIVKPNVVRVFFEKDHLHHVKNAIHNLYQVAEQKFGPDITRTMLNETKLRKAKSSDEIELNHANGLKKITANPQEQCDIDENSQPAEQKSRVYFGSYVDVTKANLAQDTDLIDLTQDIESTGDIKSVISKLTQCYNDLKNYIQTTISTTVGSVVDEKIKPLQTQINDMQTTHERKYEQILSLVNNNTLTAKMITS